MNHLLLLGRHHGNEPLDDVLKSHIKRHAPHLLPYIKFKTANLKAKRSGVRFIESDMNRSYDGRTNTYESRRASRIRRYIMENNFDIVLDLHTTNCVQPPCLLVHNINPKNAVFIKASHINKIVDIQHPIVRTSLIGTHPNSISIEITNKDLSNNRVISNLVGDIERCIFGRLYSKQKTLYRVDDLLMASDVKSSTILKNFETNVQGFIPILTGENSYKKDTHYIGFRADKADKIEV